MELKLLEDFVCLSDVRNFSRAAELRNVTQSTLSKRIRTLEHWVGAPLVDRSYYPVQLTAEGRVMIRQVRDLVQQFNTLRSGIKSLSDQPRDHVSILALHTLRVAFLPQMLKRIEAMTGERIAQNPVPANAAYGDTVRMFRNGESDMLLTYVHPAVTLGLDPKDLECVTLGRERILPVSAPDADGRPLHDLDRGDVVRFLSYGTQSFFAQVLAPLLRERPVAMNVVAVNAMSVGLHSLALVGSGMAWVPESLIRDDLREGRLVLAGKEDWIIGTGIAIYRKHCNRHPVAARMMQALRQQAETTVHVLPQAPAPALNRAL